jgi:hypothetical protein
VTVLIDDHLLRDWMGGPDHMLRDAVGAEDLATTNLWYARLCKSVASQTSGGLLAPLNENARREISKALVRLPHHIEIVPMREVAWRMGVLSAEGWRLSTLGSEAVAAAEHLAARVMVSQRDESPGIRESCRQHDIPYSAITR